MSQSIRQSQLFAAEDWKSIHRAFTEVNFAAYDFDTIRESMVQYLRLNFPEDFNDWIESSEFVALIDLLAYLGQSLAFRTDINARENFLDTAERRESILRLARMLSYNPRRNFPATGLLKINQVSTNQNLLDSNGRNLANTAILWDDANNPDWFEQVVLILNAAFVNTNPYGRPVSDGTVGNIKTQLYELNNTNATSTSFSFSANAGGESLPFEIINPNFESDGVFYERTPRPDNPFHLIYRNDGNGNASNNTGFFLMFKQGTLQYEDYQMDVPLENRVTDISAESVNDTDVWLQEIDDDGNVIDEWTQVPNVAGNNVIYNSIDRNIRNIFSVITRDRDQVSLRFADGRFGNVPTGNIRAWYRQSSGTEYDLHPSDISGFQLNVPYFDDSGEIRTLSIQYSLQYTVSNAQSRETIDQIRERAPRSWTTQDRMVNNSDYNVFPLNTNRAIKLKTVNRVYSGHNRYIDNNDPTGNYQNTNVFAEDGIIYREFDHNYDEQPLPSSKDSSEIVYDKILPMVQSEELSNFFYWYATTNDADGDTNDALRPSVHEFRVNNNPALVWQRAERALYSTTGVFGTNINNPTVLGGGVQTGPSHYLSVGAIVKFRDAGWATITDVKGDGTYLNTATSPSGPAPVTLDHAVESGDPVEFIIPSFRLSFVDSELEKIRAELRENNTFGLRYNFQTKEWIIITAPNLNENGDYSIEYAGDTSLTNRDASWLIKVIYTPDAWKITGRGLQYVFESYEDTRFFFVNRFKTIDLKTSKSIKDFIKIMKVNEKPNGSTEPLGRDYRFELYDNIMYEDGYIEPRRVKIRPMDSDSDGLPDNPLAFDNIVFPNRIDEPWNTTAIPSPGDQYTEWDYLVFWSRYTDFDGYEYYRPLVKNSEIKNWDTTINDGDWLIGHVGYSPSNQAFYECTADGVRPSEEVTDTAKYKVAEGRGMFWNGEEGESDGLMFQWRHYAPFDQRIDPASTNIMDVFVLTQQYYNAVQTWIESGASSDFPEPPTSEDLRIMFNDLKNFKMASDEMVYHPVKFKLLFGEHAPEELRVKFKAIKLPSATLSDGEIKSRIIRAINDYFNINNWDFGDTFYYTELSAYIHQQLATEIASIVPVPLNEEAKFGNLFEIKCENDEIFLPTATVSDIQILTNFTQTNMRIGR